MTQRVPSRDATVDDALAARMGRALFEHRRALETQQDARHYRRRSDAWRVEHLASAAPVISAVLSLTGMRARGRRNAHDVRVRHNEVRLAKLPAAFDGFVLLHLTDLHIDCSEAHLQSLVATVHGLAAHACVLTGDYRFGTAGPCDGALAALARLVPLLPRPVFGVLGNHDGIAFVRGLEALGVQVLMNERHTLSRGDAQLHIAGIDDAHYFRTHDIGRATAGLPPGACAILLSHTPQPYREAAAHGCALMLSGHTHGGQICLPGGVPVITDSPAPRSVSRGAWREGAMAGYTSVGCGSSVVEARFQCPPEVVLHTLRSAA